MNTSPKFYMAMFYKGRYKFLLFAQYMVSLTNAGFIFRYNIVGDGTPQALIPLLTGSTELELPDTRKRIRNSKYVNEYPFIWNDYKNAGYVTAFFEDVPELSTFTYRLNGFQVRQMFQIYHGFSISFSADYDV